MELIMTAPTPSLKTIDAKGEPVFQQPNKEEIERILIYPEISNGIVKFAKTYISVFNKMDIYFSPERLEDWINIFCDFPTEIDKGHFANIKHTPYADHSIYATLMQNWYN